MARKSARPSVVVGHEAVVKLSQGVLYTALVTLVAAGGAVHKLRVRVEADSYVAQSSGRVERWDGAGWQEVWSMPGQQLLVAREKLVYRPVPATVRDFAADVAVLLQRAGEVL